MAALNYKYNYSLREPDNIYQILGHVGEAGVEAILRNHTQAGYSPHVVEAECWKMLETRCKETGIDPPTDGSVEQLIEAVQQFEPEESYELVATQEWVTLDLPGVLPMPIRGPLDFRGVEQGLVVIEDCKVGSVKISTPKKEWVLQLGVYCLAVKRMLNLDYLPAGRIIYLHRGKKPSVTLMDVGLSVESLSNIFVAANSIAKCLELDWWPPNRKGQYCNERNCSFWYRCHADHLIPWGDLQ